MSIVLIIFRKGLFITVYLNLPLCYIVYYSLVLHLYVRNLNRIFLSQKRAVRIVTISDFCGYSQPLFLDIYIALIRSMLHTLCFHIIIYNYCHRFFWIFLLLVAIFIIIILELLRIFVLMPAEPIRNNLLSCFKAQKFGILYENQ